MIEVQSQWDSRMADLPDASEKLALKEHKMSRISPKMRLKNSKNGVGVPRPQRIGSLKRPADVAKFIAKCMKRVERGGEGADPNTNYKLVMMASMLIKALEASEVEDRLSNLERSLDSSRR
jgi:hypothetical protein